MKISGRLLLVLAVVVLSSCSGGRVVPDRAENRTAVYEPGSPNFDMEVISTVDDGVSGLDAYVSIPRASLVYLKQNTGFSASFEIYVSVREEGRDDPAYQTTWTDTVHAATYESTQSFEPILIEKRLELSPGSYVVEMALEDAESRARTVRSQDVEVVRPGADETSLSEILLRTSRGGGAFLPAVSLHIPAGYDSLQAVTQLYNVPATAEVSLTLVRFASDTAAATPPHWFTPAHFTLPYVGVDYDRADTVQVTRRAVRNASDQFSMEFDLPALDEGVFRAAVEITGKGRAAADFRDGDADAEAETEPVVAKTLYFTVKGPSFPRITSLDEMIASLEYIARETEMAHIRAASNADERKQRFDAFWAERVPNKQAAANLLSSYYERVEQANIMFTNHKDGWKTDRGMIYIVFGPPVYIDNRFTRRDWYYFERGSIVNRLVPPFVFKRSMAYGLAGLFDNYLLQRSEVYEETWRRQREDWRDGSVL